MNIKHTDSFNWSPGFRLAIKAFAELVADVRQPAELFLSYDDSTVYAENDNGQVVGVIVWRRLSHVSDAFIQIGYVEENYRRKGIYTALYAALVEKAKADGLISITGTTGWHNEVMRSVAEKQKRPPSAVTFRQVLAQSDFSSR